jgi:acetylornithine deacetylase/succinyl-diaminopimelate desuccinylase-like protein
MAARLKAAGFTDSQLTLFTTPEHPKEGGLVAIYPGTSTTAKPILLIAHIDVVEAKREDWERDPFTLFEENGHFCARGVSDVKSMAAVWVDALIRFKQQGYAPKRTIKMALTCGEETNGAFNGIEWLAANRRDLIDAEFALNEGGGGDSDGKGKVIGQSVQVGEKTSPISGWKRATLAGTVPRPCATTRSTSCRGPCSRSTSTSSLRRDLAAVIEDPGVTVTALPPVRPSPPAPSLDSTIVGPMQTLAAKYWPGIPVIPAMANGYTDATFLGAAGIPTYGVPGAWADPDGNGAHGLNERIAVRSLYVGRDYLYDLIKAYAE